ncbi:unnamed protein product [Blepharisma stoltei]|uniref:PUM-HD domain-containing protein n=1 Tax=Blepharisma stoltei TaxID=1481888 RepID=A0AAU9K1D0_9CILI|nr:unnamed protein product [Blepharisma stoltei]
MASPFYHKIFGDTNRSSSAPPLVDSNTLFAFPMDSDYASPFSRNFGNDLYKDLPGHHENKQEADTNGSGIEDEPVHTCSTTALVDNVVNNCIREDENSPDDTFYGGFSMMANFNAANFVPEFYGYSIFTPQDVYTRAVEMAKDQSGCRLLQKKLEELNPFTIQTIFEQLAEHVNELMVDPFGNYLIQKLIEVSEEPIISSIIMSVSIEITQISLNAHGTRAVQKLLEICSQYPKYIYILVNALNKDIITLIKDINGNHVIQKCLNVFEKNYNNFIYEAACKNMVDIATHRHGCCVLQRCIDAASPEQLSILIDNIVENAVALVKDAFGNYVVQYIIDLNSLSVNARLALIFMESMQDLSTQKFSSNVIEKCLQQNSSEIQQAMIQEIGKPKNLAKMLTDQYANYVVQRALTLASPAMLVKMLKEIKSMMEDLKKNQFGKRIHAKLLRKYPELMEKGFGRV